MSASANFPRASACHSASFEADASRIRSTHACPLTVMVVRPQSSAAGVLALLDEPEPLLKEHALKVLISLVPQFWAEISEHIALMYAASPLWVLLQHTDVYVVNPFTKARIYLRTRASRQLSLLARSTTILKSTTKLCLSRSVPGRLSKRMGVLQAPRNTSRLSYVGGKKMRSAISFCVAETSP